MLYKAQTVSGEHGRQSPSPEWFLEKVKAKFGHDADAVNSLKNGAYCIGDWADFVENSQARPGFTTLTTKAFCDWAKLEIGQFNAKRSLE